MRKGEVIDRVKVGIFGAVAIIILSALIFYIGSSQHKLGSKTQVIAIFKDVSGLKKGNAVRFSGVIIGAVEKIEILKDSAVRVTLGIDKEEIHFIRKDSRAIISTEGLLGSKFIRVSGGSGEIVSTGDIIETEEVVGIEQLVTVLGETGNEAKKITHNLNEITDKINKGEGTIGALLTDKTVYYGIENAVTAFGSTGKKSGELTQKMMHLVDTLQIAGSHSVAITENMKTFSEKLNNDSSTLGKFISDTAMARQVDQTLVKFDKTAEEISATSQAVRSSWLVKLFSKKKKKNNHQSEAADSRKK